MHHTLGVKSPSSLSSLQSSLLLHSEPLSGFPEVHFKCPPPAPAHTHVSCLLWHNLAACCCLQLIQQEVTSEKKMGLLWREGQLEHRGRNWNTRQKKPVPFMHSSRKKNKSGAGAGNSEEWWQETWQGRPGLRERGMGLMPEESQKCISSAEQGWAWKPPQTSFLLTVLIVELCDTWDDYEGVQRFWGVLEKRSAEGLYSQHESGGKRRHFWCLIAFLICILFL